MLADFIIKPDIPKNVKYIINELSINGFEAYIVGGCVRDELRGVRPKDWDIATSALPEQMKEIFKKTYDTGIKHGTVTIRVKGECYEATTYRIDGLYGDNRHPNEVIFTKSIVEDLRRRDFTMNAIAYSEQVGFVDPFGGINDINSKIIRAVMEPAARFQEDGLRMLRAIRFSAQTDFNIEKDTWEALKENNHLIKEISVERIRDEIVKTLMSDYLDKFLLLWDSGIMELIIPREISESIYRDLRLEAIKASEKDVLLRLSILLKDLGKEVYGLLRDLKFDNKTVKGINILVANINKDIPLDSYSIRKYISETGRDVFFKILKLRSYLGYSTDDARVIAERIIQNGDCVTLKDLKINGDELKALGFNDGKIIGEALKHLFDRVMQEPELNDSETLKAMAALMTENFLTLVHKTV